MATDSGGETPSTSTGAGAASTSFSSATGIAWRAARDSVGYALVASAIGVAAMLGARFFLGIPTPAEIFGDRLTTRIPLGVFSTLLSVFGPNAKHLYFGTLVIAQGIAMAALASGYWAIRVGWTTRAHQRPAEGTTPRFESTDAARPVPGILDAAAIVVLFWLVSAVAIAPLVGGGAFGGGLSGGLFGVLVAELIPALVLAGAFVALMRGGAPGPAETPGEVASPTRRRLLRQVGFAAAILAGGALAWRFIEQGASVIGLPGRGPSQPSLDVGPVPDRISPPPTPNYGAWTPVRGESPEVTPTANFYYVSKNLVGDPDLDAAGWRLEIAGLVDQPSSLTYDALRSLPSVAQDQTLECISNEVGGNLISNAHWTGVRLADLLTSAGIKAGASELIFRCADGYSDSLHLTQALGPRALVVYQINGQPLPKAHGFPARLLVPGLYGMKNGKWVTRLEVGAGTYQGGYWEQQGWSREARVKTMTRIDVPGNGDLLTPRPTVIAGVAFSGDRGISQVDVSVDGGRTWSAATLKRPLADQTWVLWELPWQPNTGSYVVTARAVDLAGFVQSPAAAPTLPDGASGYHAITVNVG